MRGWLLLAISITQATVFVPRVQGDVDLGEPNQVRAGPEHDPALVGDRWRTSPVSVGVPLLRRSTTRSGISPVKQCNELTTIDQRLHDVHSLEPDADRLVAQWAVHLCQPVYDSLGSPHHFAMGKDPGAEGTLPDWATICTGRQCSNSAGGGVAQ